MFKVFVIYTLISLSGEASTHLFMSNDSHASRQSCQRELAGVSHALWNANGKDDKRINLNHGACVMFPHAGGYKTDVKNDVR